MAPVRHARGGSPAPASGVRNNHQQPRFPLPKSLIQEIAALVAKRGRTLVRIEVSGHVKDNFDDIYDDDSDEEDELVQNLPRADLPGPSGNIPPPDSDNDLTSLSWLQDRNLLRDMNLGQQSSDDDTDSDGPPPPIVNYRFPPSIRRNSPQGARVLSPDSSTCSSSDLSAGPSRNMSNADAGLTFTVDEEPNVVNVPFQNKPPFPFAFLIFRAMDSNPEGSMRVKDIYAWIMENYPYYKNAPPGWKNSVRHNLSLNKWFHKVSSSHRAGRGCLWSFDPNYREILMESKCKQQINVRESPELEMPRRRRPNRRVPRAPKRRVVKRPSASNEPCPSTSKEQRPSTSNDQSPSTSNGQRPSTTSYEHSPSTSNDQSLASSNGDRPNTPSADEYYAAAGVLAFRFRPIIIDQVTLMDITIRPDSQASTISTATESDERNTAEALLTLAGYSRDDSSS